MPSGGGVNGFARTMSAGTSTRRPTAAWPRLASCASGSTSGPATAVPGRLEVSIPRPPAGGDEPSSTAATPAAQPGRPSGAASSSTSAGRPPAPPGAGAVEAGVVGELVPVQVELASDETHDGWRHKTRPEPAGGRGGGARIAHPSRYGKRGQQVRRWLGRRGRRAVRPLRRRGPAPPPPPPASSRRGGEAAARVSMDGKLAVPGYTLLRLATSSSMAGVARPLDEGGGGGGGAIRSWNNRTERRLR